jgi:hypothetical protein
MMTRPKYLIKMTLLILNPRNVTTRCFPFVIREIEEIKERKIKFWIITTYAPRVGWSLESYACRVAKAV